MKQTITIALILLVLGAVAWAVAPYVLGWIFASDATSIGIIGGADGPTGILVSRG